MKHLTSFSSVFLVFNGQYALLLDSRTGIVIIKHLGKHKHFVIVQERDQSHGALSRDEK